VIAIAKKNIDFLAEFNVIGVTRVIARESASDYSDLLQEGGRSHARGEPISSPQGASDTVLLLGEQILIYYDFILLFP